VILDAAERLLIEGGPLAVEVRAVAHRVGMTDAGVYHHFGTREALLLALLRHGGRRLRDAVERTIATWTEGAADVESLIESIAALYRDGYAALAVALHGAGWRDRGGGLLEPVVQALQAARMRPRGVAPPIEETRLAVAALHQALATEPLYGTAFRRSAGLDAHAAARSDEQLAWWAATLTATLGLRASRELETRLRA
jgi:AcrR family transcriptional regulator